MLGVDLDGVFLCIKHAGARWPRDGGGSIINIASIKAFGGSPGTGHYGAAKAGVVSLTKTAALELRAHGVRVNAICPGWFTTDMVSERKAELESVLGVNFDEVIAHIQGRLGEPEEIAGLALFLASDRSRFASGTAYVVDGGATASLVRWTSTSRPRMPDLLRARRDATPTRPFVRFKEPRLTYGEFDARTDELAGGLAELGVGPGDVVSVFLPNCIEFLEAWWAILKAGGVLGPVNPAYTASEAGYILEHAEAVALITDARGAEVFYAREDWAACAA